MPSIDVRSVVGKLNITCRKALEQAAAMCVSRTNYNVEWEHWLLKLLEAPGTDVAALLRYFEIDRDKLARDLTKEIDTFKTGNSRPPALSPTTVDLAQAAWLIASFSHPVTRSGHVLAAIMDNTSLRGAAIDVSPQLEKISSEALKRDMAAVIAETAENMDVPAGASAPTTAEGRAGVPGRPASPQHNLEQYTVDLTARAAAGKIEPVIGREHEIRQIIDILTRRRQNNPILTGEAGVGKTAVIEGFASRIVAGDVPQPLKNVRLLTLDLGLLQAGAGMRGEFENRLKSVIDEVKASPVPIILFIDEAHTLIGAGGAAGQGDAANMLKPALARGELRTIAATTWAEYKKYFEKDAALARRFQVVKVDEPSEPAAMNMMRGIAATLEKHHKVRILDEAIIEAVRLSHRYLSGRQMPDKCYSVLDTACGKVALGQGTSPQAVEDCHRQLQQISLAADILTREAVTGAPHTAKLAELMEQKKTVQAQLDRLLEQWKTETALVAEIRTIRQQLEGPGQPAVAAGGAAAIPAAAAVVVPAAVANAPTQAAAAAPLAPAVGAAACSAVEPASEPVDPAKLRLRLDDLRAQLHGVQGDCPLMGDCVDAQCVCQVISAWTGIPVGRMVADEIKTVLNLKAKLEERIIGQSHALEAVGLAIRTSRANMTDPRKPIGVFLMVGTSGVGKTETALALADLLYGGEQNVTTINMSEFKEEHKVSLLMGSPPGYVGYGEGGVLTEAVRRKPYSIVLLDEMEKAHPGVQDIFYQVFDKGMLRDGEGRDIDFKNTIIIMTSNAGTDLIMKLCADPDTRPSAEALAEALHPELLKTFKPAFLGRVNIIPYFPLGDADMRKIVQLQLGRIKKRVGDNYKAVFTYDDAVIQSITQRCREVHTGARNIEHILTRTMLPELSAEFLTAMAENKAIRSVHIGIGADGRFKYDIV